MANGGRFDADPGIRGGSPFGLEHTNAPMNARGGTGAETTGVLSSQLSGNVHSSRGFRRALKRSQAKEDRLKDQLPNKTHFGGPGFKKPNYFAQGGARRGMHIGSGAPAIKPARMEGAGGERF